MLTYHAHLLQVPDLDVIVGSISAGGFMAGMCVAAKVSTQLPFLHERHVVLYITLYTAWLLISYRVLNQK